MGAPGPARPAGGSGPGSGVAADGLFVGQSLQLLPDGFDQRGRGVSRGGGVLGGGVRSGGRQEQRRSRGGLQTGAGHVENTGGRGGGQLWEGQNLEEERMTKDRVRVGGGSPRTPEDPRGPPRTPDLRCPCRLWVGSGPGLGAAGSSWSRWVRTCCVPPQGRPPSGWTRPPGSAAGSGHLRVRRHR